MVAQYQKVKAIKVRVYKWKERIINEEFSDCGLLQCTVINESMHVKRHNKDFLEASRKCSIVPLEPLMVNLPCSYKCSYSSWDYLCFALFSGNEDGDLITKDTAWWLSETIAGYLTSNYQAARDLSRAGERDFKIVVAVNVYMRSIIDESIEIDFEYSLNEEALMYEELIHSDEYGLEQRKTIGPIHDFLLETGEKCKILEDFLESDRNSLLNLYASSGDENMIFRPIIEWLTKETGAFRLNPEQESWFEEVKPALEMKKFDAGCDSYSEENCAICLEEFCEGDLIVVTPCSHIFHCHSIVSWLAKEKMTCPMCRTVCPVMI